MENYPKNYTMKDVEEYGNRLYFNTVLNISINFLAVFLILNYSTKAMGAYKYFILMTIIGALFTDLHTSSIFGLYTFFPLPLVCSAGLLKYAGWFWGATFQWAFMHISFAIGGMCVFYGFVYQYYSITGNAQFFHKPKTLFAMFISMIIYPLPSIGAWVWNVDWEEGRKYLEQKAPYAYDLYFEGSCVMNILNYKGLIYLLCILVQIIFLYLFAIILAIRIYKTLAELKSSLSKNSLKARKQFLKVLLLQMAVPGIFLVIPAIVLIIGVVFNLSNFEELSHWLFQFFGLHSCGNAATVIIGVKPYRQAILNAFINAKRILYCQPLIITSKVSIISQATTTNHSRVVV